MKTSTALLLILLVAAPLLFVNLGGRGLWAPDEPRFAQIGREMVRSGNWIVPRMNGQDVALLPPLTYWLVAIPSRIAGDVNEFTARCLIATCGLLGVLAVFFLGKRLFGTTVGLLSALVLATSHQYLWQSRWLQSDMPLVVSVTAALTFFYHGLTSERHKRLFYRFFCLCMGLGVLAKGPLAVVLPGLVILPYIVVTRSWRRLGEMCIPTGILVFLIVVVPWYVAVGFWGGREFLHEVVVKHNFGMFFDTWSHKKPFYFYIPHIFWLTMPWALFILPAAWHVARREGRGQETAFVLCWLIVPFLFFSYSEAKQGKYLAPIFPAASIVVGKAWRDFITGAMGARMRRVMTVVTVLVAAQFLLAAPVLPLVVRHVEPILFVPCLGLSLFFALAVVPLVLVLRRRPAATFAAFVGLCLAVHLFRVSVVMPRFNVFKCARQVCDEIGRLADEDDAIGIFGIKYRQIGGYRFYLDRPIEVFEDEQEKLDQDTLRARFNSPQRLFVIVKDEYLSYLELDPAIKIEHLLEFEVGHTKAHVISNGKAVEKGVPKA